MSIRTRTIIVLSILLFIGCCSVSIYLAGFTSVFWSTEDKLFFYAGNGFWGFFVKSIDMADPNARNEYGYTYLALACYQPNVEIVEKLIKKGSDVNSKDNTGWTPLHAASYKNNTEVVRLLLSVNADPNIADDRNKTPLFLASHYDTLQALLSHGANPNHQDKYGWTKLHDLLMEETKPSLEIIELLCRYGADPYLKNENPVYADSSPFPRYKSSSPQSKIRSSQIRYSLAVSPFDMAKENGYNDIVDLMQKYKSNDK